MLTIARPPPAQAGGRLVGAQAGREWGGGQARITA